MRSCLNLNFVKNYFDEYDVRLRFLVCPIIGLIGLIFIAVSLTFDYLWIQRSMLILGLPMVLVSVVKCFQIYVKYNLVIAFPARYKMWMEFVGTPVLVRKIHYNSDMKFMDYLNKQTNDIAYMSHSEMPITREIWVLGLYLYEENTLIFKKRSDAIMFKLKFGDMCC